MESSRRDLLNDMAEHRSILKNNQNTFYPRFCFTPKPGTELPETGVLTVNTLAENKETRIKNTKFGFFHV